MNKEFEEENMNILKRLTIKNLKLNKTRTIATILGIVLSVALITAVTTMYTSAMESLIRTEKENDGNIHLAIYGLSKNKLVDLKNNRNIDHIYLTKKIGYAKLDESKNDSKPYAFIMGMTNDSIKNLGINIKEGRLPENEDEIVIPSHLRTNGRVEKHIGDTITLNVGKRILDGQELTQSAPFNPTGDEANIDDLSSQGGNEEKSSIDEQNSKEQIVETSTKTYKIVGIVNRPSTYIEPYSAPGYTFITYLDENNLENVNSSKNNSTLTNTSTSKDQNSINNTNDSENNQKIDVYITFKKQGFKDIYKNIAGIIGVDSELYNKLMSEQKMSDDEVKKISQQLSDVTGKDFDEIEVNQILINLIKTQLNPFSISPEYEQLMIVVAILCVVIMVASIICIKNSFNISITEKTKQYGMLRSIGATKKQIKNNVLFEALILGAIGIPFGILLGIFASYILVIICNKLLISAITTKLILSPSLRGILISVLLGIITIYLSALGSSRRAKKVSPIESIRNSGEIKIKSKKLKTPKLINKIFGIGGVISYKNIKRNRKKYRATIISITLSVMLFLIAFSFVSGMKDEAGDNVNRVDCTLELKVQSDDPIYLNTLKLDNIKEYTVLRYKQVNTEYIKLNKEYINCLKSININITEEDPNEQELISSFPIIAVGKDEYSKYLKRLNLDYENMKDKCIFNDYQKIQYNNNKVYKGRKYANNVGDKIKIIGTKDNTNTVKNEIAIGAVTDILPMGIKSSSIDGSSTIIVSDEYYDKIFNNNKFIDSIYFDSDNTTKLQDDIEQIVKNNELITNLEEQRQQVVNIITLVNIFLYGFIIVIVLIGITNIFNTITTNMELRKPEFAMLKSVGMTNKEFNKMIRLETLFMGIRSLIWGLIIGTIISIAMFMEFKGISISEALLQLKIWQPILISVIAVFVLLTLIMNYSMKKTKTQNIIETIRNENI